MKISEDLARLIELGNRYGERVEYTRSVLKVELDYATSHGSTIESLTHATISIDGSKKLFTLSPIHPCPGVYDLEPYRVALANLTEFTDALMKLGYSYLKVSR
jgi:hypothetical protein